MPINLTDKNTAKELSISYEEAAAIVQEHLDSNQISKLQHALSLLLPTQKQQQRAKKDKEFTKQQVESALLLKDDEDFIRAIGYILLHGASGLVLTFKEARFLKSLRNGDWILLDEVNLAREESLGVLYGLLTKGYLDFNGERINLKEKAGMLFAAGNPSFDTSRYLFSEALENRFQVFYTPKMKPSQVAAILFEKYQIKGISFTAIKSLVELNDNLDRLMRVYKFEGLRTKGRIRLP
jgi:midasin (ATPase involved in ribosome maturation)